MALTDRILEQLKQSQYWTDKTKDTDTTIQNLTCPSCGDGTAWSYKEKPFAIICNRLNKCGARTPTLELFMDITKKVERDYPGTKEDPHRPARAYLEARGLTESLKKLKPGQDYMHWPNVRQSGSGAAMFKVTDGVFNGRLYNPPRGEGKTHNRGSTKGKAWFHPGLEYDPAKPLYVTEGLIDCLSLIELGVQAAAALSAGQEPTNIKELDRFKHLITAFDNDTAGRKATKKWQRSLEGADQKIEAMLPVKGDWNDFIRLQGKEEAIKRFTELKPKMQHLGRLATCDTAQEYSHLEWVFNDYKFAPGLFAFGGCYYWSFTKRANKEEKSRGLGEGPDGDLILFTVKVSNFTVQPIHYRLSERDKDRPTNEFYLEIIPRKGRRTKAVITAADLASPNGLTSYFLRTARVVWEGDKGPSLALARLITGAGAQVVRELEISGYDVESEAYVLPSFAITKSGEYIQADKAGYISIGNGQAVRPCPLNSYIEPEQGRSAGDIYRLITKAWPGRGEVAFTWTVASWFVNQIKAVIKQYPILSLFGEQGSGKSYLIRTMKAMQCMDSEGLPMRRTNTSKGELRRLAQLAGLFEALLEWPDNGKARFELENILTLYNNNPLHVMAQKSNDNRTNELPFLAALSFVQNREPFYNVQQKERVISLYFSKEQFTEDTTEAFDELNSIPARHLAYIFIEVMKNRKHFESYWYEQYIKAVKELREDNIVNPRIAENYGLMLAFNRLLDDVIKHGTDIKPLVTDLAREREYVCQHRQETVADTFLNTLLSYETDDMSDFLVMTDKLKIYLPGALSYLEQNKINLKVSLSELQTALRELPCFIDNNINVKFGKEQKKCWIFDPDLINQ